MTLLKMATNLGMFTPFVPSTDVPAKQRQGAGQ